MMNNENYNINNGDDNNTLNPPPPTLEHVLAIQGQLFQTMVLMQQTILRMQFTDERTQSRKSKNDTQGDASHTLDERTKKQLKIFVAEQVDYDKQIRRMSKISHDYMDFFGFCHTRFLRPKPDAHRMYAQDQVVIHMVRM
jgi:hypothetical protein